MEGGAITEDALPTADDGATDQQVRSSSSVHLWAGMVAGHLGFQTVGVVGARGFRCLLAETFVPELIASQLTTQH